MEPETIVISVGGSLICPGGIDTKFLSDFKRLILKHLDKGKRFIIITGGGRICRDYQEAARKVGKVEEEDVDWLGIHVTRVNAHLMRTIFRDQACAKIVFDPTEKVECDERILVAAGWKPGFSTDYDSVMLGKQLGVKRIINLTNIDYVYDKDPRKHKDAKKIEHISWKDFRKIVGNKWHPGLNAPFDPVASKECEKSGMTVYLTNGKKLKSLDNILSNKNFIGTTIS
jgi:uridylate kinase